MILHTKAPEKGLRKIKTNPKLRVELRIDPKLRVELRIDPKLRVKMINSLEMRVSCKFKLSFQC